MVIVKVHPAVNIVVMNESELLPLDGAIGSIWHKLPFLIMEFH